MAATQETVTIAVLLPADKAGAIIGKAGAGLKQIREGSACHIEVEQNQQGAVTRRADLKGQSNEQLARAMIMIAQKIVPPGEVESTICIVIPAARAGVAVGKGGDNLKRARTSTGIKVSIERDTVHSPSGAQERIISFIGDMRKLEEAARIILGGSGRSSLAGPFVPQISASPGLALPSTVGQIRPLSGNPEDIQAHMIVPDKLVGAVLGKDGAKLKETMAQCGCKSMTVSQRDGGSDRRVIFVGGITACTEAQKIVYYQSQQAGQEAGINVSEATVILMIPRDAAGAVIGKEGAGIKSIREKVGVAKLNIVREEFEGVRPCTITGPIENVVTAQKHIWQQVLASPADDSSKLSSKRPLDGPTTAPILAVSLQPPMKRARKSTEDFTVVEQCKLLIPTSLAGAVIGKGGATLKLIRESHGVIIEVLSLAQAPEWGEDRVVILKGSFVSRQSALQAVLAHLFGEETASKGQVPGFKMLIPSKSAGTVIGKGARNLKTLREQTGANISVEREEVNGDRLVIFKPGSVGSVTAGASAVLQLVDSSTESNALAHNE